MWPYWLKRVVRSGPFEVFDESFTYTKSGLSKSGIQAAKGLLICLVVIGHIRGGGLWFNHLKNFIYNFHVMSFFMISMLHPVAVANLRSVTEVAFRYLRLLIPISLIAFIIFNFGVLKLDLSNTLAKSFSYMLALIGGNYASFDQSTGLELFWYMYALIGLIWVRMALLTLKPSRYNAPILLLVCLILGHFCASYFPSRAPSWIGVSTYIFPVLVFSLMLADLFRRLESLHRPLIILLMTLALTWLGIFWVPHNSFNVAWLKVPLVSNIIHFVIWILFLALAFRLIVVVCNISQTQFIFSYFGHISGHIYLLHMFFLFLLDSIFMDAIDANVARITVTFALVMILSSITAHIMRRL